MISFSPNKDICFIKGQIFKAVKLKAPFSVWPRPKSTELLIDSLYHNPLW